MDDFYSAEVEAGDPHNDQLAAYARDDLDRHIRSAEVMLKDLRDDGGGDVEATAVIAMAFIENSDMYAQDRIAAMLAVALLRLTGKKAND